MDKNKVKKEYNKKILDEMKVQSKPFFDDGCDYFISGHYQKFQN